MSKKRSFTANYAYNLIYEILILIVPLLTTPYVSRILGAKGIGDYGFTAGIVSYFGILAATGTVNYAKREIACKQNDVQQINDIFWEIYIIRIVSVVVVSILYFLFIIFSNSIYKKLYIIQFITVISWGVDISWFFQGIEDFKIITVRNSIVKILSTLLIFLLIKKQSDLWKYTLILSMALLLGNLFAWPAVRTYIKRPRLRKLNFRRHFKGIIVMFSSVVAVQIYTVLDQTMLGILSDTFQVAYYVQAQKIIKLALTIISAMATVLLPRIAVLYSNHDKVQLDKYFCVAIDYLFILALPMCSGCILCSKEFVPLFFGNEYIPVIRLMQILSILFVVLGAGQLCGSLLTAIDKQIQCMKAVTFGAITNFILNCLLIKPYLAIGAAVASVIAETIVTLYEVKIINGLFEIKYIFKSFIKYSIPTIVMDIYIVGVKMLIKNDWQLLMLEVVGGGLVYIIVLCFRKDKLIWEMVNKIKT